MLSSDAKHCVSKHEGIDTRVFQQPVWTKPSHKPGVAQVREVTRRQRQNWRPGLNSLRGGQGLIQIGENVVDMLQPD